VYPYLAADVEWVTPKRTLATIRLGNVLVFSLVYGLLDSGGPLARYLGEHPYPTSRSRNK
jgi:hypothetical protein